MTTLQFADTYNFVVFLAKPAESEGFEQIVDFLNAHTIKYALTVNPTIYTSCIEQFWATVKVKIVNEEIQLQVLVDGKKIIVTEASVKEHMVDEELEQLLEGTENVVVDAFMDDVFNSQEDLGTRIEPTSDKESLEVEKDADMVIINDGEEEESVGDEFELRMREKGKGIEETRDTPPPTPIRSPRTHTSPLFTDKETL
ncbi:hypothetical protein Tco_1032700 [Tanacetum coccineum]|uniref:Xylulose kinase-1 n=1 Tax=Tanacetum coccineum TaxID=301880 RepID=A0ABQ5GE71_9ASTR